MLVSEHGSTLAVDHLGELLTSLDTNSVTMKGLQLHHTKCTRLLKQVIAPSLMQDLRDDIGNSFFSLIIDESINVSNIHCLGIVIRFYSMKSRSLVDTMYRLVSIEFAKADDLYATLASCLSEDQLDIDHLLGIGCDGANAMVGKNHSLSSPLKMKVPDLVVCRCVGHSLHLAASKATDKLPVALEFLVCKSHSWFSCSPKRMRAYYALFEAMAEKAPNKIPGHSETRWLAKLQTVSVILEQREVLALHFRMASQNERC